MEFDKRGVSAVVATVLMITMVVSLGVIVFAWSNSFFEESSSNVPSSKNCNGLDFKVFVSEILGGNYDFEILNRANVDIGSFRFSVSYQGNSNVVELDRGVLGMEAISGVIDLGSDIDEVLVYAVLGKGVDEQVCDEFPLILEI
ncbi:hypothetical protein HNV12_00485 [Methanococcoides sp. SA1]|nr:hypothetical protein [Methanococcoides sp. SA1]